jgi:hypothetical protein
VDKLKVCLEGPADGKTLDEGAGLQLVLAGLEKQNTAPWLASHVKVAASGRDLGQGEARARIVTFGAHRQAFPGNA